MRPLFRKLFIAAAAVNAAAVAGAVILTAVGSASARSQDYNFAADRWRNGGKGEFTQISCFFSPDAGFDKSGVNGVRSKLTSELAAVSVTSEDGRTLFPDAYSYRAGEATVTCDLTGRSEADITAVGGDFFLFRGFRLTNGSFFDDDDIMQDGAVIDTRLAWNLYGSDDVAGMSIYINDVRLYISGVIETPSTDPEERCAGDVPRAYISSYAAGLIFGEDSSYGEKDTDIGGKASKTDGITCYECVVPDPVENFAYNTVNKYLSETYKGKVSVVNNTERFDPKKRAKALKKLGEYVVADDGIVYPFWENASRMVDVRLSFIYGARRVLLAIPLITALCLIIMAYRQFMRKKEGLKKAAAEGFSAGWRRLRIRLPEKAAQTGEKES